LNAEFASAETNWPRWRGSEGTGHSSEKGLPVAFDKSAVAWKVNLPGVGQSSPIIWGDKLFLTTSVDDGSQVNRVVLCYDKTTGKKLWEKEVAIGSGELLHGMNTHATSSCCTDGDRVVAFFGRGGLFCLDMDGDELWSHQFGDFAGAWGTAASPVIVDDLVIQNCDAEGASQLFAFDKKSGRAVWNTKREAKPKGGWATPILIEVAGHRELILNGELGVRGYDPKTGKELWFCHGFNGRGTPTPAVGKKEGLLYVVNGKPGDLYAVTPGGKGDVTQASMKWHTRRSGGRDLPSPIYIDGYVFVINMKGKLNVYDSVTGEDLYSETIRGNYSSSPIAAGGLIYIQDEAGKITVIRPAKTFEPVASNSLGNGDDEIFRASLAPSDGRLYARSDKVLYCIGK